MNSQIYPLYRHSGKIGAQSIPLIIFGPLIAAFPLGYVYAYLIHWIPFIYLNFFITVGYGFLFGLIAGFLLRMGRVRNNWLAALGGLYAGGVGLYFNWNGHIHATFEKAPAFAWPHQVLGAMAYLYEHGSWTLRGGYNVTGVMLAIVWLVEALMIVGLSIVVAYAMIGDTPFCERSGAWLDEKKQISTLAPFTNPAHIAAFQAGDIEPLSQAQPKVPGTSAFGRVTIKYSAKCDDFCTVTIANVTETADKNGKMQESVKEIARNVVLPKSMFDFIAKFEHFNRDARPVA